MIKPRVCKLAFTIPFQDLIGLQSASTFRGFPEDEAPLHGTKIKFNYTTVLSKASITICAYSKEWINMQTEPLNAIQISYIEKFF